MSEGVREWSDRATVGGGCVIRKNQDDDDDDDDDHDDDPSTQGTKCGAQMLFRDL